jgi:hypothetical protein
MKPIISARHALNESEFKFCKAYSAGLNAPEAYRRAFVAEVEEIAPEKRTKEVSRRARALLKQDYIERYLEEIGHPAGERARAVLTDQALFGSEASSRKAAEKILADEDKLGFRDAVERFLEIMVEVGADVEVPLPGRFQKRVQGICECGEIVTVDVDEPLNVKFKAAKMFGKDDDADV